MFVISRRTRLLPSWACFSCWQLTLSEALSVHLLVHLSGRDAWVKNAKTCIYDLRSCSLCISIWGGCKQAPWSLTQARIFSPRFHSFLHIFILNKWFFWLFSIHSSFHFYSFNINSIQFSKLISYFKSEINLISKFLLASFVLKKKKKKIDPIQLSFGESGRLFRNVENRPD